MGININSKILLSVASIAAAAALIIGATFAFFSDEETSNNNVFGAGTLDLVLCDVDENTGPECDNADEAATDSVTASFGGSDLVPGQTVDAGFIELQNNGSIAIAEVELLGVTTETVDPGADGAIVNELLLDVRTGSDSSCSGSTNQTTAIDAAIGNGDTILTLGELGNGITYDALPGIASAGDYFLCMSVTLDSDAGNGVQGDAAEIDLTFTANQDASQ